MFQYIYFSKGKTSKTKNNESYQGERNKYLLDLIENTDSYCVLFIERNLLVMLRSFKLVRSFGIDVRSWKQNRLQHVIQDFISLPPFLPHSALPTSKPVLTDLSVPIWQSISSRIDWSTFCHVSPSCCIHCYIWDMYVLSQVWHWLIEKQIWNNI